MGTYPMDIDSNTDLLDSAFEEVKIEQPAQNEMMMLAEYDVPVIHIAEPQNNTTNQIWSANSIFDEENSGLSSSPSHYMMTINPYEAEGQVSTINVDDLFNPQPSTSTVNNITIKTEVTEEFDGDEDYVPVPAKRPRGRPSLPRSEDTLPRRPRGRPATAPEYANVSEIDSEIEIMSGPQKRGQ